MENKFVHIIEDCRTEAAKRLVGQENLIDDILTAFIAASLEILNITENRYSGIPTIYAEMKKSGLLEPKFENIRGTFKVTLYNEKRDCRLGNPYQFLL